MMGINFVEVLYKKWFDFVMLVVKVLLFNINKDKI